MSSERLRASRLGLWGPFALLCLVTAGVYALYGANVVRWRNSPDFGWRTMYDSGPNFVAEVFEAGRNAGLRVGDTILAINGKPYQTFDELFFGLRNAAPGSVNRYTVERAAGAAQTRKTDETAGELSPVTVPGSDGGQTVHGAGEIREIAITTGRIGLKTVLLRSGAVYLIGLVYVLIGILVFLMKPGSPEAWLFLVMTAFLGPVISLGAPADLMEPLWFYDARILYGVLFPAATIHLALRFPRKRRIAAERPWLWTLPYLVSLAFFVAIKSTSTAYWNIPRLLDALNVVYILAGLVVFILSMFWNVFRDSSHMVKMQSKMIILGLFVGLLIPTSELLSRSLFGSYLFASPALGFVIFLTAFPLAIGYTIVKHDLFAIDAIIKRTYGYILTTGTIAGAYASVVLISNLAFGRFEITKSPAFPIVFVLAVILLFNPLRDRAQKLIDRVFYRLEYDYQETVERMGDTMRSLLGLDQVGRYMVDTALGTMFLDSGCVMLLDREGRGYECLARAGTREKETAQSAPGAEQSEDSGGEGSGTGCEVGPSKLPADDPLVRKLAKTKKALTVYDLEEDSSFDSDRVSFERTLEELGASLVVPLVYKDRLTGLIALGRKKSGKFFRREDINLLKVMANQGAVAIENARMVADVIEKERMEEELSIARDLQGSMLPASCPQVDGFEIAAFSVSAREVGGDFYDFIEVGDGRVGFAVGDVTGKSVSGALVMAASRSVFRMLSEERLEVGELMARANRRLKQDVTTGMFVALLYGELDAAEGVLTFCSAGQTQPVHVSAATGEARLVETAGDTFPLGILDEVEYEGTRLTLAPGDTAILYTDGIVEAMNETDEIFGFERLLELARVQAPGATAEGLLKAVEEGVLEFAGKARQHDDMTVIVVRACASRAAADPAEEQPA